MAMLNPIDTMPLTTQYRLTPLGRLSAKKPSMMGIIIVIICCWARARSSVATVTVVLLWTNVERATRRTNGRFGVRRSMPRKCVSSGMACWI